MTEQEYKTAWQNEPDSKELSEMATEVRRSFAYKKAKENTPAVEVDKEWQRFCANHAIIKEHHNSWHRWAIAASMLLLCSLGFALGWPYIREWKSQKSSPQQTEVSAIRSETDTLKEDDTKLTFRNAELKAILHEIAVRHGAQIRYGCQEEIYLYVEMEKSWTLQQCIDFLNHFDRVNLKLTQDNIIVAE